MSATTKYFIKVKALVQSAAQANFQDSSYSGVIEIATQTPLALPTGVTLQNITGQSINVRWTPVANASGYEISWGTSNTAQGATGSPATVNNGNFRKYVIQGLSARTKYYVKIKSLGDSSGSAEYEASRYSAAKTATTTKIKLPAPSINLPVSSRTDSSITVKWPKVANASAYEISWGSSASATGGNGGSSNSSPRTITPGSGSTESATFNGLAPNRNYYFKVRAKGSGNYETSDWSGAKGQKTLKKMLLAPQNLRVVSKTDKKIKVSWDAVPNASGYRLTLDGTPLPRDIPGTSQGRHTILGLQRNKSYTVKIMALGGGDYKSSSFSTPISAQTKKTVLAAPTLRVSERGQTSISLSWAAVPNATGYQIKWMGRSWNFAPANGTSHTISGLNANTTYNFQIQTVGSGDFLTGLYGSAVPAKTKTYVLPKPTNVKRSRYVGSLIAIKWDAVPNGNGYIVEYKTNAMPGYKRKEANATTIVFKVNKELGGQVQGLTVRVYAKGQGEYTTSPPATITIANP